MMKVYRRLSDRLSRMEKRLNLRPTPASAEDNPQGVYLVRPDGICYVTEKEWPEVRGEGDCPYLDNGECPNVGECSYSRARCADTVVLTYIGPQTLSCD